MIQVDRRFGGTKKLPAWYKALQLQRGVELELTTLTSGDVSFKGDGPEGRLQVGIELKTVPDFLSSLYNGRLLGEQLPKMSEYQYRWLIIEGFFRARHQDGFLEVPYGRIWRPMKLGPRLVYWNELQKLMTHCEVMTGIKLRQTRTGHETARAIVALYQWWDKPWEKHKASKTVYAPPPPQSYLMRQDPKSQEAVFKMQLHAIPGVGWERAEAIMQKGYRDMSYFSTVCEEDLQEISGIGKQLARDIVDYIHGYPKDAAQRSR